MKIFISSTVHDLKDIRSNIKDKLTEWGYNAVLSEHPETFPVQNGCDSYTACIKEVPNSKLFILIIDNRKSGIVPDEILLKIRTEDSKIDDWFKTHDYKNGVSITELEYITAVAHGIPVKIFCRESTWIYLDIWKVNNEMKFPPHFSGGKYVMEFLDRVRKIESATKENWVFVFKTPSEIIDTIGTQLGREKKYTLTYMLNPRICANGHNTYLSRDVRGALTDYSVGQWRFGKFDSSNNSMVFSDLPKGSYKLKITVKTTFVSPNGCEGSDEANYTDDLIEVNQDLVRRL